MIIRHITLISCEDQWQNYLGSVILMFRCGHVVVHKVSFDPTPHGYPPKLDNPTSYDPLIPNHEVDEEDVVVVSTT